MRTGLAFWIIVVAGAAGCQLDWNRLDPREGGAGVTVSSTTSAGGIGGEGAGGDASTTTSTGGTASTGGGGAGGTELVWGTPETFPFNDPVADDDDATFTADGLELYFNSGRVGASIWVSRRTARTEAWGEPEVAAGLNEAGSEANPVVAPDGLSIYFSATRDGQASNDRDIYVATRPNRAADWSPAVLADGLNEVGVNDYVSVVSADGLAIITDRGQLYQATRTSLASVWSSPVLISELAAPFERREAWWSTDQLTMYFNETGDDGDADILVTRRTNVGEMWAPAVRLDGFDSPTVADSDPWLTDDERLMFFSRYVDGQKDIFFVER